MMINNNVSTISALIIFSFFFFSAVTVGKADPSFSSTSINNSAAEDNNDVNQRATPDYLRRSNVSNKRSLSSKEEEQEMVPSLSLLSLR